MKRLFVCNNPYQIVVSVLIANSLEGENSIIITDNFRNSISIYKNIQGDTFFSNAYRAQINKIIFPKNPKDKAKKLFAALNCEAFLKKAFGKQLSMLNYFDELYYNNDDLFLYNLVGHCYKYNKKIEIFRYEEGYSSYIREYCSLNAQKLFNIKHIKNKFRVMLKGMYYFYPDHVLFENVIPLKRISKKLDARFKNTVKNIFKINESSLNLNDKYIIFEESFFQDYGYNDDYKLYKEIIGRIGKDKVVMKLHPRSKTNRFQDLGIEFLDCDGIPWEAFLLLCEFKNVKFITLASGSVINSRLMLGDNTKSYLLYKCVEKRIPSLNQEFEEFITTFNKDNSDGLYIPKDMTDFWKLIQRS